MWPFPNEALIKSKMAAYSNSTYGLTGNRGFCTGTSKDGSAQTLTKYIWEYLGNRIPSSIYGLASSPPAGLNQVLYTVTASAGTGGSIAPSSLSVPSAAQVTFVITPNSGYKFSGVTVNGTSVTATAAGNGTYTYTIPDVEASYPFKPPSPRVFDRFAVRWVAFDYTGVGKVIQYWSGVSIDQCRVFGWRPCKADQTLLSAKHATPVVSNGDSEVIASPETKKSEVLKYLRFHLPCRMPGGLGVLKDKPAIAGSHRHPGIRVFHRTEQVDTLATTNPLPFCIRLESDAYWTGDYLRWKRVGN